LKTCTFCEPYLTHFLDESQLVPLTLKPDLKHRQELHNFVTLVARAVVGAGSVNENIVVSFLSAVGVRLLRLCEDQVPRVSPQQFFCEAIVLFFCVDDPESRMVFNRVVVGDWELAVGGQRPSLSGMATVRS
jgi:hypothetical protein